MRLGDADEPVQPEPDQSMPGDRLPDQSVHLRIHRGATFPAITSASFRMLSGAQPSALLFTIT